MKAACILADPPWRFRNWSMEDQAKLGEKWGRANGRPLYTLMDTEAIAALPVQTVAQKDCTLLLWATNPLMPEAFRVLEAWEFTFKTMLTWVKMSRATAPRIGLGYHARACTEHLLVASRGNPGAPPVDKRPCGVVFNPIGAHSAKPDFQYTLAENYPGPWLELFHRPRDGGLFPPRPGWTFLGDEVDGLDMRDALQALALAPQEPAHASLPAERHEDTEASQ